MRRGLTAREADDNDDNGNGGHSPYHGLCRAIRRPTWIFTSGVLGLRLVKVTVNFDAPDVYHFYFGNETGKPGRP